MVVTTQIVKKKKRERKKKKNERRKEEKNTASYSTESRARMHTCKMHCPVSENECAIAITQRQHIYDREEMKENA
jgi:hypothetical protein